MIARRALLAAALAAFSWAVATAFLGGFLIQTMAGRVSSRDARRPLLAAAILAAIYLLRYRQHWPRDAGRLATLPWPRLIAAALALSACVAGVRWGTFVAGGADASGYISQAEMWREGMLTRPTPPWVADATWPDAVWSAAPPGYLPGVTPGTIVPVYSPGLPLVMAAFAAIGGPDAVYLVGPLFGALAVAGAYLLGSYVSGPWGGVIAALLMASSPAFLVMLVQPMSDVPVTALWSVALWLAATRRGWKPGLAAGAIAACALLTRPNLAPLVVVVGAVMLAGPGGRARDAIAFAAAVVPAVLIIAALNTVWDGSPLQSGYGALDYLYAWDRVLPNLRRYLGWLAESQTPAIAAALLAPLVLRGRGDRLVIGLITIVVPLTLLALYAPYLVFDDWSYLRFLLPAYPSLFAGLAAALIALSTRVPGAARPVVAGALALGLAVHGLGYSSAFAIAESDARYTRVVAYTEQLPAKSVFVSLTHAGTIAHYTGRGTLRWDLFGNGADLDRAVEHLRRRGYRVYLVADAAEMDEFAAQFRGSMSASRVAARAPVDLDGTVIYALAP